MELPFGDEEHSLELKLTFNGEMLSGEVFLPIVGQALVEGTVLFGGNVLRIPRPDGLGLVEFLIFNGDFLDLLRLLWLVLLVNLLNRSLPPVILFGSFFVAFDLLINLLARPLRNITHLLAFSTFFVTASWMGYEMNSECFLTASLILFSSRYSS